MNQPHTVEKDVPLREVWGLQVPPSVHVGREFPERRWAERQLKFAPDAVLVRRFVTEWEQVQTRVTSPAKSGDVA